MKSKLTMFNKFFNSWKQTQKRGLFLFSGIYMFIIFHLSIRNNFLGGYHNCEKRVNTTKQARVRVVFYLLSKCCFDA